MPGPGGLAVAAALGRAGSRPSSSTGPPQSAARGAATTSGCTCTPRGAGPVCPGTRSRGASAAGWRVRTSSRYLEEYVAHHRPPPAPRYRGDPRRARRPQAGAAHGRRPLGRAARGRQRRSTADHVVVATGYNHTPVTPDWPGLDGFTGELVLARDYRNGRPFAGRDVLVVGTGNTGTEIATDLAEHGATRVWLAVRTPPHIVPRATAGVAGAGHRHPRAAPAAEARRPGRGRCCRRAGTRPHGLRDAARRHRPLLARARGPGPGAGRRHRRRHPHPPGRAGGRGRVLRRRRGRARRRLAPAPGCRARRRRLPRRPRAPRRPPRRARRREGCPSSTAPTSPPARPACGSPASPTRSRGCCASCASTASASPQDRRAAVSREGAPSRA